MAERRGERRIALRTVPTAHLAGEERALIRFLDGGPLLPTTVPPLPAERGLRRRPTLVQNPETLAHLALIARHGSEWFRAVGTTALPGSALLTVSGALRRSGVQEVACGTPLAHVLERSGGALEKVRAVLLGGYHGEWVRGDALDESATSGAGVVVVLGASCCGVRETARVLGWLSAESAGQCGPCANGLPAIADLVHRLADGRAPAHAIQQLERWAGQVVGRGACRLPDGAVRFLRSSLRVFAEEYAEHAARGPCHGCLRPGTMRVPRPRRLAA
jgi:NADH:ubiquinone oxidoreductase subunit F (NADH-binding)